MKKPFRPDSERASVREPGLLDTDGLRSFVGALVLTALGVSLALCVATLVSPITAPLSGSNLEIVPSLQRLAHPEPREKNFLFLAAILGSVGALVGAFRTPLKSTPDVRSLLILATLVPGFNIWIGLAMSHPSGISFASIALLHSLVAIVLLRCCRTDRKVVRNES